MLQIILYSSLISGFLRGQSCHSCCRFTQMRLFSYGSSPTRCRAGCTHSHRTERKNRGNAWNWNDMQMVMFSKLFSNGIQETYSKCFQDGFRELQIAVRFGQKSWEVRRPSRDRRRPSNLLDLSRSRQAADAF